jgi:hypothetical protein
MQLPMGHGQEASTTLSRYVHPPRNHDDRARRLLDDDNW